MEKVSAKISLNILCLEDSAYDRQMTERALAADGLNCRFTHTGNRREFETALNQGGFDLILSDFSLPAYDGTSALLAAKKFQPATPFVLLSGTIGEERVVELLKSGATDCVLKNNLSRLGMVVRRALNEARERERREAAEAGLRAQAEELRALAGRLQAGREEERIRIAREIHDEFGESLTAQKFGLGWLREHLRPRDQTIQWNPVFAKLDALSMLVDGTAGRVRRLCTELRPPILDDLGLCVAIEWQAREFQRRTNIRSEVVHDLGELVVGKELATTVFRIFQEILTNVARHANASKVSVHLQVAGKKLVLEVKDNGKGINENTLAKRNGSLGILGMRERAALFGGKVAIRSAPAKGTTVILSIPLNQPVPPPENQSVAHDS
jgi:signal transduction histidine kinase